MQINQIITVKGCMTQERYLKGKTLPELEHLLGFQKGRLDAGIVVAALIQVPSLRQFELLGYSQVAEHKFSSEATKGLNVNKLKEMVLHDTFTTFGNKRLIKVMANTLHNDHLDNDIQYPPGLGVPQWKLTGRMSARVVAVVLPGKVYQ